MNNRDKVLKQKKDEHRENKMIEAVADLFWEYDRMSSSGKETLDNLAILVGIPTQEEFEKTTRSKWYKDTHNECT